MHITRGALGLIKSEAELAGVLGHEIAHVAQKHTVNSIEQSKTSQARNRRRGGQPGVCQRARRLRATTTSSRRASTADDENEADEKGIRAGEQGRLQPGWPRCLPDETDGAQQGNAEHERPVRVASRHSGSDRSPRQTRSRPRSWPRLRMVDGALQQHYHVRRKAARRDRGCCRRARRAWPEVGAKTEEKKTEEEERGAEEEGFGLAAGEFEQGQAGRSYAGVGVGRRRGPWHAGSRAAGGDNPNKVTVTITPAEVDGVQEAASPSASERCR